MRKLLFLAIFLISISSAFSLTQVIAGVDRNITFPITNGTNNPLSGATCNINTYYPNITLKDFQLSSSEANVTNADGVYFVTLGETYSENETGIYTLNAVCTSLGETGAGSMEFAIVKNNYSFMDNVWQIAIIMGTVSIAFLLAYLGTANKDLDIKIRTILFLSSFIFMLITASLTMELANDNTTNTSITIPAETVYTTFLWVFVITFIFMFIFLMKDSFFELLRTKL